MITFTELAAKLKWRISGGGGYLWKSFGINCRYVDFDSGHDDNNEWGVTVFFDTNTCEIRQVTGNGNIWSLIHDGPWCWTNPAYIDEYKLEAKARGFTPFRAWDNVDYFLIENDDEVIRVIEMIEVD